jgi:hypothetical protein
LVVARRRLGRVPGATVSDAIERASRAYASLAALGETVEDEWSYVTDLHAAWQARFDAVSSARRDGRIDPEADAAVGAAIDEVRQVADPHRAIDWLSTFPQVVLLALGDPT